MPPEHARDFGGGLTETALSPFVLVATILATILILVLPRKYAALPLFFVAFFVPLGQALVLGGAHLFVLRIVILAGMVHLKRGKSEGGTDAAVSRVNAIDKAYAWCMGIQMVAVVVLFRDTPALINQFGFLIDNVVAYFLLRRLLQAPEDIYRVLKFLAVVTVILAVCMIIEQEKLLNVFSFIGGSRVVPEIREGKIRSQGPFSHELTAGCFAATLIPLFVMLWKSGKSKLMASIGLVGATVMTITSNSSTPLLAYVSGVLGIVLWPIRRKMKNVRQGLVLALVGLAMVMKAPVWFIISHIDLTGGSSGYHRAVVIDAFIRHFWDWWLIGVKETGSWGWDLWDTQNQFVNVGQTGGLAAFIFFLILISRCFGRIGDARKAVESDLKQQWPLWFLGSALFANITAFFGVNYFDQSKVSWIMLLAMISTMTVPILATAKKTGEVGVVPAPTHLLQVEQLSSLEPPQG